MHGCDATCGGPLHGQHGWPVCWCGREFSDQMCLCRNLPSVHAGLYEAWPILACAHLCYIMRKVGGWRHVCS